ncbi:MAG: 50S ribosomal protein L13 [Candidatus Pacearchaeota archaeon]|nr:50S ribosomal protein L13 [Candidatus Pacearchaeota archaeon]
MNEEIIVDAEGAVAGRLASFVAKRALLGYKVYVINSEKAIIIGSQEKVLEKYLGRRRLGRGVQKGPKFPSRAEMILRRIIRGMLPWKKTRGREAFKRIKCFLGVPDEFKNREVVKISSKEVKTKYISLAELSNLIRQK